MDKKFKKRYSDLSNEFEQGLGRTLTDKEKGFLKWLVEQECKSRKRVVPNVKLEVSFSQKKSLS